MLGDEICAELKVTYRQLRHNLGIFAGSPDQRQCTFISPRHRGGDDGMTVMEYRTPSGMVQLLL
jgi:hypothetical protein